MKSPYYVIPTDTLVLDASLSYGDAVAYDKLRIAAALTANAYAQKKLRGIVYLANYLRGMGCGADTELSGETTVFGLLPAAPVIFDVGAHIGEYARTALAARPKARVYSFEPSAHTFRLLTENLAGTGVALNRCGLGDRDETATLWTTGDGSGMASLSKRRLEHFGMAMDQKESVSVRTLDGYCSEHGIDHIDLLKIDVEGHEMDVLRGAMGMISAKKIGIIAFEFGGTHIDTKTFFQDFWYFFKKAGAASISRITPSGWLAPVESYTEDLECFKTTNYVVRF